MPMLSDSLRGTEFAMALGDDRFCVCERPDPGMLVVSFAPFFPPTFRVNPFPPIEVLVIPFEETFNFTPGAIFIFFLNFIAMTFS